MILSLISPGSEPLLAISVRLYTTWRGPWSAELDVDLGRIPKTPSGKCTIKIGEQILVGTIDPDATSKIGDAKAHVRVVGGGKGWSKTVDRLAYHNDARVLLKDVMATTAVSVGETVLMLNPLEPLGFDYVRMEGPASSVLAGRDWHVRLDGVTYVGPRLPTLAKPGSLDISEWDPITHKLTAASDDILAPGTVITDTRIGSGTTVVRTVEQTWGAEGSQIHAWCSTDAPKSSDPLDATWGAYVDHRVQRRYLAPQLYRVVTQDPMGRLVLQSVHNPSGAPDVLPIKAWPGIPGASAKYTPGQEAVVEFIGGDPTRPIPTHFDGLPIELTLDATVRIAIGLGTAPVALAPALVAALGALATFAESAKGGPTALAAAASALSTALAPLIAQVPSKKLYSE